MRHKITDVIKGSVCDELGIKPGDLLVAADERPVRDIIDYNYYDGLTKLSLTIINAKHEAIAYDIEKTENEHLGLCFENNLLIERPCPNKCPFCFADQWPKNMPAVFYKRCDDWRSAYIQNKFTTLTDISERDIERIIKYHISPLNISVHATDPVLRGKLLGNSEPSEIMPLLRRLAEAQIKFNTQIILCPDINDGSFLRQTFEDLFTLFPYCASLAVVPVRLTYHRKKLARLRSFTPSEAKHIVEEITKWQESCLELKGSRFIYPSDCFYLLSDIPSPETSVYEDFKQINNGVGLMSRFKQQLNDCLDSLPPWSPDRKVSVVTSISSAKFAKEAANVLSEKYPNVIINIYPITNFFCGESVTEMSLLTGKDIAVQLEGKDLGSEVLISKDMLQKNCGKFLDNISVGDVENWINKKVTPIPCTGDAFAKGVLGIQEDI